MTARKLWGRRAFSSFVLFCITALSMSVKTWSVALGGTLALGSSSRRYTMLSVHIAFDMNILIAHANEGHQPTLSCTNFVSCTPHFTYGQFYEESNDSLSNCLVSKTQPRMIAHVWLCKQCVPFNTNCRQKMVFRPLFWFGPRCSFLRAVGQKCVGEGFRVAIFGACLFDWPVRSGCTFM